MDHHKQVTDAARYLLGEDLLLEIGLPELQTMLKKEFCPDFPEAQLKTMDVKAVQKEIVNLANSLKKLTDPAAKPITQYTNAQLAIRSIVKKYGPIPYPYPTTLEQLTNKSKTAVKPQVPLTDLQKMKQEILYYCPKFPKSKLEEFDSVDLIKLEIVKMATAVFRSIDDPKFPKEPVGYVDSKQFLEKWIAEKGSVPYPYPEKADKTYNPNHPSVNGPSDLIPFPNNTELLKKYYNHTVDLGWPGKKIEDDKNGKIIPQADSPSYIPFSLYYRGKVDKETEEIRPYNMPKLVAKAMALVNTVYNKNGGKKKIDALRSAVDNIIEADKKYKMTQKVRFVDKFAKFVSQMVRLLGGNEADDKVIQWLARRSETMTVFEFQKLILDEVAAKNSVTDETRLKISKTTEMIRKALDNKDFIMSGNKGSSWTPNEAYFIIENAKKISPVTVEHVAKPMLHYLETLMEIIGSPLKKEFTKLPDREVVAEEIQKLNDWIAQSQSKDKKTPVGKYEYGDSDDQLTLESESDGNVLTVRPIFNEKDGVSVYINYNKETDG